MAKRRMDSRRKVTTARLRVVLDSSLCRLGSRRIQPESRHRSAGAAGADSRALARAAKGNRSSANDRGGSTVCARDQLPAPQSLRRSARTKATSCCRDRGIVRKRRAARRARSTRVQSRNVLSCAAVNHAASAAVAGGIGLKIFLPCAGGALEHRPMNSPRIWSVRSQNVKHFFVVLVNVLSLAFARGLMGRLSR